MIIDVLSSKFMILGLLSIQECTSQQRYGVVLTANGDKDVSLAFSRLKPMPGRYPPSRITVPVSFLVLGQQLEGKNTCDDDEAKSDCFSVLTKKKEIPVTWLLKEKKIFSMTHGNAYVSMKASSNKFRSACFSNRMSASVESFFEFKSELGRVV
jgi:hypothetical protein